MPRAHERAGIGPADGGWAVLVDGAPILTPLRAPLVVPTEALAAAIAEEWRRQGEKVRPDTMPMTQMAVTALDRVRPGREPMVESIVRYGETDLVCYRASAPPALVERQRATWQPLVDWVALVLDASLRVVEGVMPDRQPAGALTALRAAVAGQDDWRLAALSVATAATGSLVLGLALLAGQVDAAGAWAASQVDETFQIEQWGEDAEAAGRRAALRAEIEAASRFLALLQPC
ncbi:MAG: ATP12 family chaperone protein [Alphaproteobacteria bacterium]